MDKKPNHICKYSGCKFGENGSQKEYYTCPDCKKYGSYKEIGCCADHAWMYQNEVAISRGQDVPWKDMIPQMVEDGVLDKSYMLQADTETVPEPTVDFEAIEFDGESTETETTIE